MAQPNGDKCVEDEYWGTYHEVYNTAKTDSGVYLTSWWWYCIVGLGLGSKKRQRTHIPPSMKLKTDGKLNGDGNIKTSKRDEKMGEKTKPPVCNFGIFQPSCADESFYAGSSSSTQSLS
jgi:hypothetical protein